MRWAKRVWRRWTTKPVGHCSACCRPLHSGYSMYDGELLCKGVCNEQ